ncbi:MAG TPA: hypothetical protein EYN54_08005 [Methylococcaceae bacterium]|nr:hypothetical protein [Methylococcaceae bacterium]
MSYTLTATDTSIKYMQQQIDDEPITNDGVNYTGDQMTIIGTFTPAEETTIDSFVLGGQLAFAQEAKLSDVRIKTVQLISDGFTHSSNNFPLVLDNRSNYIGIQVFGGFPYKIQNSDQDDVLVIADQAAYDLFVNDGLSRYRYIKDEESELIIDIRDATTITAVNAIVDGRV